VDAVFAPGKTPPAIVEKLNHGINRVLMNPELRRTLLTIGIEPAGGSSEEIDEPLRREVPRWETIVKEAGLARK
jgi:tripartite-type tricarboxylate transporter receptor subunit TctC